MDFLSQKNVLTLCICVFTLFSRSGNSQETKLELPSESHHEITTNLLTLSLFSWADFSYEYVINKKSSLGMDVQFDLGRAKVGRRERIFSLTPNYRQYFFKSKAPGSFIEFFGILHNHKEILENSDGFIRKQEVDLSLGFSLGQKWIVKKHLVMEIFFGVGAVVIDRNGHFPNITERAGASIGYRF